MTATTCITYTTRRRTLDRLDECRGPVLDLGDGRYLPLDAPITRLGRRPGTDLQLDDQSVSGRHALLLSTPVGVILLHDRGAGGTYLNDERVDRTELMHGDEVRVGDVRFTYLEV
ncbi:MAG: FHA domain-containing protein [Solirubrobacteraceae bacterium]